MNLSLLYKTLITDNPFKVVNERVGKYYPERLYDKTNFLFYPNKKSTMLLQAHIDTVRKTPLTKVFRTNDILFTDGILGADDRAGVWGITEIVEMCRKANTEIPNILFTNFEESGSGGMKEFVKATNKAMFSHIHMAIALDRHGCGHYVKYNELPTECEKYIKCFGWDNQFGTYSDISKFTDEYFVPSINVAIGYHNEHTANEHLNVDELTLALHRVKKMLIKPIDKLYPSVPKKTYYTSGWEAGKVWSLKHKKYMTPEELREESKKEWKKYNKQKDKEVKEDETNKVDYDVDAECDMCSAFTKVHWFAEYNGFLCEQCNKLFFD